MVEYSDESRTKRQRREHIVEVAKRLCYERSIANTTMHDIAKEAGIGRSTMYEYFKSKLELLALIRRTYLNTIYDFHVEIDGSKTGFEQLEDILVIYFNTLLDHPQELVFFMEFNRYVAVDGVEEQVIELDKYKTHDYLSDAVKKGVEDGSLDVTNLEKRITIVAEAIFGAAMRFATKEQYIYEEALTSVHRSDMREFIHIVMHGLKTDKCKHL